MYPCILIAGDQLQLEPMIMEDDIAINPYREQLKLSFMQRMINIGHKFIMLTETFRFVEQLNVIPNLLTYGGQLVLGPGTALEDRPVARRFKKFAEKEFGIQSNRILVDIPSTGTITDTHIESGGTSKGNDFMMCYVAEYVTALLTDFQDTATIAIMTPYKYQHKKYTDMANKMRLANVPNIDRMTVSTINGAQGREYDIVILDFPLKNNLGFLADEKRMNVALTRARNGLILVASLDNMHQYLRRAESHTKYPQYTEDPMSLFKPETYQRLRQDTYPKTPYHKPAT